jgi:hypothetical protein
MCAQPGGQLSHWQRLGEVVALDAVTAEVGQLLQGRLVFDTLRDRQVAAGFQPGTALAQGGLEHVGGKWADEPGRFR